MLFDGVRSIKKLFKQFSKIVNSLKSNGIKTTAKKIRVRIYSPKKNRVHKQKQDEYFKEIMETVDREKIMVFLFPPTDTATGGLMSLSHLALYSSQLENIHGYKVFASTVPGIQTISGFSEFESDLKILRFEQIEKLFYGCSDVFFQVPEMCVESFCRYLRKHRSRFSVIPHRRMNILNQNINLMPDLGVVDEIVEYFDTVTQTCAHSKYCTEEMSQKYKMPLHLLPADYPVKYYPKPYFEKENIIAYSNDIIPQKAEILKELKKLLNNYEFVLIENLPFIEYKKLISRAKFTISFGEGWDGYFFQPYFSESIGICVFNENFCPKYMKSLPTVFDSYDNFAEKICTFVRNNDNEESYNKILAEVKNVFWPPQNPEIPSMPTPLEQFYLGNYTIFYGGIQ